MNSTSSTSGVRGALRDMFQFHFGSLAWLPALFTAVAVGAIVVLIEKIVSVPPGGSYYYDFRMSLVRTAVVCWAVSTLCAYVAGFVMGRLYVPRA
jgi:hypothetical protein